MVRLMLVSLARLIRRLRPVRILRRRSRRLVLHLRVRMRLRLLLRVLVTIVFRVIAPRVFFLLVVAYSCESDEMYLIQLYPVGSAPAGPAVSRGEHYRVENLQTSLLPLS